MVLVHPYEVPPYIPVAMVDTTIHADAIGFVKQIFSKVFLLSLYELGLGRTETKLYYC